MKTNHSIPLWFLSFLLFTSLATAGVWPGFRGATGVGVAWKDKLPAKWSEDEGVKWKLDLPGRGNSSPVITKDRIYLTTQTEDKSLWVIGIDKATGKQLWKKQAGSGALAAKGPKNLYEHRHNSATPTPAASEWRVFAFFGTGDFVCFNKQGRKIWERDLVKDYGEYDITFGMGSSPRLWKGGIYLPCMTKGPSYVIALDPQDGKTIWKKDRKLPAEDDGPDAYSTPVVWRNNETKAEQLLVSGSDHVNAYDLKTGEQLWVTGGLKIKSKFGRVIASPAVSKDVIVQCSGNPGGDGLGLAIAFKSNGKGDITESHRLWEFKQKSADGSTPVVYNGSAYMVRDTGVAYCLALKTGKLRWEERLSKDARAPYFAAAIAGDGKVYFISVDGVCSVVKAGSKFEILANNKLDGNFYATPAVSENTLYLRSENALYAIPATP